MCRNQASGYLVVVGIEFARWQQCGSPARDFAGLAALFVEGAEGKWRGEGGDFIGWTRCSIYCQETDEINWSYGGSFGSISGGDFGWRRVMTGGSHLSVSGGEEKHTGSVECFLGRGLVAVLGRKGSRGPVS
jgi:hypothetical protein